MLNINPHAQRSTSGSIVTGRSNSADAVSIPKVLREEWPIIAIVVGVFIFTASVYLLAARPMFSATTSLMLDTGKNQILQGQQFVGEPQIDAGRVESQVEILKSEGTALSVIRELKLTDEPDFARPGGSLIGAFVSSILGSSRDASSQVQSERRAARVFAGNLSVRRVGLTYVIEISYASSDPGTAARIANGIADAYMVGELEAKYQATKRANVWLQGRIQDLRLQVKVAEQAVQTFKSDNSLVGSNRGLVNDQQLGDVNAQLVTARASIAEAKARLDRIVDISRGDLPNATVTDALHNDVITRLRTQYLDLAAREADWSQRYGQQHVAVQNLRNQVREVRTSMSEEIRRIAETYKSDYEIARAREQSIQTSLAKLVDQAAATGQAQVRLRDLESSAQTARNLYDTFLQRSMEATQQQTFPITDARIITVATEPAYKSYPKTSLTLVGAGVVGLFVGTLAAFVRRRMDRAFRTAMEVEETTGHAALGIIPLVSTPSRADAPADTDSPRDRQRKVALDVGLARYAVENAFSRGAETLRNVKVAIDARASAGDANVIGITSSLPHEGKTTVAANLAQMVAHSGRSTLLIDGDLRNPSLTRTLAAGAGVGLIEVLTERLDVETAIWTDPVTGLHVLPTGESKRTAHMADLLGSRAASDFLTRLKTRYDYVFIDLPPVLPVVDVRASAHNVDGFIVVIEWGRTDRDAVLEALKSVDLLRDRMVGFVLNKAPSGALGRIEAYKGRSYQTYYTNGGGV